MLSSNAELQSLRILKVVFFTLSTIVLCLIVFEGKLPMMKTIRASLEETNVFKRPVCMHAEPIHELYRFMLGRNATSSECSHLRNVILSGQQVAYYEPYFGNITNRRNCSWGGRTEPGEKETITDINAGEFGLRGGNDSPALTALLRTLTCKLPSIDTVRQWTVEYDFLLSQNFTNALQLVAENITSTLPKGSPMCWHAMDDVLSHSLGRYGNRTGCVPESSEVPAYESDCYWIWSLARGLMSIDEVNHASRSSPEYIDINESESCKERYAFNTSQQSDPHAIGEYVTQIYRLVLGRRPTDLELFEVVNLYEVGDTRPILRATANKVLANCTGDAIFDVNITDDTPFV